VGGGCGGGGGEGRKVGVSFWSSKVEERGRKEGRRREGKLISMT